MAWRIWENHGNLAAPHCPSGRPASLRENPCLPHTFCTEKRLPSFERDSLCSPDWPSPCVGLRARFLSYYLLTLPCLYAFYCFVFFFPTHLERIEFMQQTAIFSHSLILMILLSGKEWTVLRIHGERINGALLIHFLILLKWVCVNYNKIASNCLSI